MGLFGAIRSVPLKEETHARVNNASVRVNVLNGFRGVHARAEGLSWIEWKAKSFPIHDVFRLLFARNYILMYREVESFFLQILGGLDVSL